MRKQAYKFMIFRYVIKQTLGQYHSNFEDYGLTRTFLNNLLTDQGWRRGSALRGERGPEMSFSYF